MSPSVPAATLLEAIRYEHWLRFYFLELPDDEEALTAVLRVPAAAAEASRRAEPHLFPLLEAMQGREVSLDGARDAVFRFVAGCAHADADDPAFGEGLFQLIGDPDFRRGLDAFHGWVQELANGEAADPAGAEGVPENGPETAREEAVPSFAQWQAAFEAWAAEHAVRHVTTISPFSAQRPC